MKIGFDAKRAFYNYSGLGNYSRNVISLLKKYFPENDYHLFTPGKTTFNKNFPPQDVSLVLPQKTLHKIFPSWWRSVALSSTIREQKIDIFHGLSNELPGDIKKTNVRSVVTIHDLIFLHYPNLYKRIDRNIYHKKFSAAVEKADKVIAISKKTRDDLVNFFNAREEKIEVIYQSCDPAFSARPDKEKKAELIREYELPAEFILYVGTIEERKNLLKLVQALDMAKTDIPLVVIGKQTSYARKVHQYIEQHSLRNIKFLKYVPNKDLPGLYQAASLFVYPSSYEGFGIPVLEALNSGVPVIAGKGSCLEETGGPNSLYVDPFDLEEFAGTIIKGLQDESLRKEMVVKGHAFAKNFSQEISTQNLHKLYESIR